MPIGAVPTAWGIRRSRVSTRDWYNPNLETRWNMIPALIGTLTMLQTLLLTAMSVAREREQGTFDQLLVTPFRPSEIMAGKALPSILIGMVQATNILLVAQLWFRIPFAGSFLTLYVGLDRVFDGGRRIGAIGLLDRPHDAASDALFLRGRAALYALVGALHADQQHAPGAAVRDDGQPAALRDRYGSAGLSRRGDAPAARG